MKNGIDISIPFRPDPDATRAWYVEPMQIEPVRMGTWVGSVEAGASVNFNNLYLNPHAHGTHTECVGHITREFHSINNCMKKWWFQALVITIEPERKGNDMVIEAGQIKKTVGNHIPEALIIRTLPNGEFKKHTNYSHTNPAYMSAGACTWIRKRGIEHLLIDLPSVDREEDGGKLAAHKAFWNYPDAPRLQATITELIYIPNDVPDGHYMLNLQVAPIENDASPSRPVLFTP
ncbi:MAG: cyclase family protein [Salibacteraceae bacterium]